jgi:outer membrane receptor for ferrienterochelin and colicins
MLKRLVSLSLCVSLPCAWVHSEPLQITNESPPSLFDLSLKDLLAMRLVTAANGFEQLQEEVPVAVSTISAEEWHAMGARTLFEAVGHMVGVHVSKSQTGIANDKPVIRGVSGTFGQQILILLDGVPFRRIRDGGSFQGHRIPLAGIKRIEVIRSPGSVIYGADAVGGIINMVTYRPGEAPSTISAKYGEFATRDLAASHAFSAGEHKFQLAGELQASDGDPGRIVDADLQTSLDRRFGTSVTQAPGTFEDHYEIYQLRGQWQFDWLSASANVWKNAGSGVAAGLANALDAQGVAQQRAETYSLQGDFSDWVIGDMTLATHLRREFSDVSVTLFPAGARLPVGDDGNLFSGPPRLVDFTEGVRGTPGGDSRALSLQLEHVFGLSDTHLLRWAVGAEKSEIHATETKNFGAGVLDPDATSVDSTMTDVTNTEYVYLPDKSRRLYYLSLMDQWRFSDDWTGTFGVRFDDYCDFGSTTNPRLGVVWHTTERLTLKLFGGTAFRAPSFIDLYAQNNPTALGNPDLEPEKNRTVDFGLSTTLVPSGDLQLDFNLYRYSTDNIIRFEPAGAVQVATNAGKQEGQGVELQMTWRTGRQFSFNWNYSYLDSKTDGRTDISAVPRQMSNLGLFYRPEKWHWYLGAKWVADRERAPGDNRPPVQDYWWFDSHWQTQVQHWTFSATVKNLLDEDAREPSSIAILNDFPLQGRQWLLGVSYLFEP